MTTIMVLQVTSLAGAKLVVPEPCKYYWQSIPGVKFATARYLRFYFPSNRYFHSPPSFLFISTNIVQPLTSHKAKTDHSSTTAPQCKSVASGPDSKTSMPTTGCTSPTQSPAQPPTTSWPSRSLMRGLLVRLDIFSISCLPRNILRLRAVPKSRGTVCK
jgi:hypothetical protein